MPKLKYKTHPNDFKNGANQYRANMMADETIDLDQLFEMMRANNPALTTAEMHIFFANFKQTVLRALLDGKRINTDLMSFKLSLRGNFDGPDDYYDSKRHELVILIRPDSDFQDLLRLQATLEKQRTSLRQPEITGYTNMRKGASNDLLSPSHTARLEGNNLAFDEDDPRQGVFLLPANGNINVTGVEVRAEEISLVTPTKIIFRVPDDLLPGPYRIEVRAVFGKEDLRSGILNQTLTVE
ncbi:MAG TPA: DNA-binding domain-containing protein [Anaerolineae bacterium]|nr:DUF4469 domain-containing protein [Anaerolineales bacterium]HRV92722.1 DNA-binding domain-containing protein [Anaerolineae bacterium]